MLPRISSARKELAMIQHNSLPSPLYRQKRVLNDLLELSRDGLPCQMRKSALRLLQYSFQYLVQEIFGGSARQQFLLALKELCSDEVPYYVYKEGFLHFYYMIGAGASLGSKSLALEHEDCRSILQLLKTTTQVSLKLAACAYLWLARQTFREHLSGPISETEHRDICLILSDLTQHPFPLEVRRDALDWLWRHESSRDSGLTHDERHDVWTSILEISGYAELNALLLYSRTDATSDCLSGLRRLWWFSLLDHWTADMLIEKEKKRNVGMDLLSMTGPTHPKNIRRQAFELLALFSNLSFWKDMLDESTWRLISDQFAGFCLYDTERVNKEDVMRRATSLLVESTRDSTDVALTRRELQVSRHVSAVVPKEQRQIAAAATTIRQTCDAETTAEATLENLAVFTLPGESLLIQKDQQIILHDRICNYAKFHTTRLIAIQAMYALLSIQEWLSGIRFAKGPFDEGEWPA
ncbi:hypothetical protein M0805_001476 [Coniferiporia weirii]|nr:hypothetical protein M0805_001476 [Coniferiporia weirii]